MLVEIGRFNLQSLTTCHYRNSMLNPLYIEVAFSYFGLKKLITKNKKVMLLKSSYTILKFSFSIVIHGF